MRDDISLGASRRIYSARALYRGRFRVRLCAVVLTRNILGGTVPSIFILVCDAGGFGWRRSCCHGS